MDSVELFGAIVWAVNYGRISVSASSFGLIKNALNAKQMNTTPPIMVTVDAEISRKIDIKLEDSFDSGQSEWTND